MTSKSVGYRWVGQEDFAFRLFMGLLDTERATNTDDEGAIMYWCRLSRGFQSQESC
jgi:hypothetical protein